MTKDSITCWSSNAIVIRVTFSSKIPRNSTLSPLPCFPHGFWRIPLPFPHAFQKFILTIPITSTPSLPSLKVPGNIGIDQWKLKKDKANQKLSHFSMSQNWFMTINVLACHCLQFHVIIVFENAFLNRMIFRMIFVCLFIMISTVTQMLSNILVSKPLNSIFYNFCKKKIAPTLEGLYFINLNFWTKNWHLAQCVQKPRESLKFSF